MKRKINRIIERKRKLLLIFFFFISASMQSQCIDNENDKLQLVEAKVIFNKPPNHFCNRPPDSYFEIHPDFHQSPFYITIINNDNQIMTCISTMAYPKPINKISRYLIANVDLNHISEKALALQIDTRLGKMSMVGPNNIKKLNAHRGYLYNIKVKDKYLGIYPRCKKLEIYKDNIGRAEILFFYKYGQDEIVMKEIGKTWGMLKFKSLH